MKKSKLPNKKNKIGNYTVYLPRETLQVYSESTVRELERRLVELNDKEFYLVVSSLSMDLCMRLGTPELIARLTQFMRNRKSLDDDSSEKKEAKKLLAMYAFNYDYFEKGDYATGLRAYFTNSLLDVNTTHKHHKLFGYIYAHKNLIKTVKEKLLDALKKYTYDSATGKVTLRT